MSLVASVAAASVDTDAGNATGLAAVHAVSATALAAAASSVATPVCSVYSKNSSDSEDSDMIGGGVYSSPGGDDFDFAVDGDDGMVQAWVAHFVTSLKRR